jgi:Flp pilus assembly pilin Flp
LEAEEGGALLYHLWTYTAALAGTLRHRDEGATMVEYGLLVAVIALVVLGGALALGVAVLGWFNDAASTTPATTAAP